ncbi:hypothetical protein WCE55_12590 [Luteimonas sp. MJ293]
MEFSFHILTNGVISKGSLAQVVPFAAWRLPGGYLAFYIHNNYEVQDGEGVVVEISAIVLDEAGAVAKHIPEVSSWFEYEGSIRVRDFVYADGSALTTEEVFDPAERDGLGNVLLLLERPERSVFRVYELGL